MRLSYHSVFLSGAQKVTVLMTVWLEMVAKFNARQTCGAGYHFCSA